MTNGITDLSVLHEVPYSNIEGAYVKVNQEIENDPLMVERNRNTTHSEVREGTIVGRGNGTGVYYDTADKEVYTHSIGPAIYIETREDTVLEVRTDKSGNELLEFKHD